MNLQLPICPKCGDTKNVQPYSGHVKLAQPYWCSECKIYWSSDLGIREITDGETLWTSSKKS